MSDRQFQESKRIALQRQGWNYWRSRHGVDDMCCWYDVLERIGYRVSEDERKALKGAYLGGGDDES